MFRGTAVANKAAKPLTAQSRGLATRLLSKTERDWLAQTAQQLRGAAKARGISQRGTKAEIARRLVIAEREALTPHFSSPANGRAFGSSASTSVAPNSEKSKFTPRRPTLVNVKLPDEPEEVDEGPIIPYLPNMFDSHHTQSASPIQEPPASSPRVITVASAATHPEGGPSHNLWGKPTDPHLQEVLDDHADVVTAQQTSSLQLKKNEQGFFGDILEELGLSGLWSGAPANASTAEGVVKSTVKEAREAVSAVISPSASSESEHSSSTSSGDLTGEEKRGLYAIAGLLGSGYLLSVFST